MKFSVIIPTRGDVDLSPIIASYEDVADEVLIWDNSKRDDLSVYARYAMIAEARNELILTQDDDCVVSQPQAIVDAWHEADQEALEIRYGEAGVVCNMPPEFRHDFYEEHALVGFGAFFHRKAPRRAFDRFFDANPLFAQQGSPDGMNFGRTCDVVFTGLTPRVLVDVPYTNLPWADGPDRMYQQPEHQGERARMLELVKQVA